MISKFHAVCLTLKIFFTHYSTSGDHLSSGSKIFSSQRHDFLGTPSVFDSADHVSAGDLPTSLCPAEICLSFYFPSPRRCLTRYLTCVFKTSYLHPSGTHPPSRADLSAF